MSSGNDVDEVHYNGRQLTIDPFTSIVAIRYTSYIMIDGIVEFEISGLHAGSLYAFE